MSDEYTTCAALLHDVLEDTTVAVGQLEAAGFPGEIIDALKLLTHNSNVSYFDYIQSIRTNRIAAAVKLVDLRHNSDISRLEHIDDHVLSRVKKYQSTIQILTQPTIQDRYAAVSSAVQPAMPWDTPLNF